MSTPEYKALMEMSSGWHREGEDRVLRKDGFVAIVFKHNGRFTINIFREGEEPKNGKSRGGTALNMWVSPTTLKKAIEQAEIQLAEIIERDKEGTLGRFGLFAAPPRKNQDR